MDSKALFWQLDQAESRQLQRWESWIKAVERSIPWREMERLDKASGTQLSKLALLPEFQVNITGLGKIMADHGAEMIGAGMAHGDLLVAELHKKYRPRKLADLPGWDPEKATPTPEEAISVMERRSLVLSGDVGLQMEADIKKPWWNI